MWRPYNRCSRKLAISCTWFCFSFKTSWNVTAWMVALKHINADPCTIITWQSYNCPKGAQESNKISTGDRWDRDTCIEGTGKEIGGRRKANAMMDVQIYEARQDKKRENTRGNESGRNLKKSRKGSWSGMGLHAKRTALRRGGGRDGNESTWEGLREDGLTGWGMISERRDCRRRKCTTVLHGGYVIKHRLHINVGLRRRGTRRSVMTTKDVRP